MPPNITQRIKDAAFDLLKEHPAGLRYSELVARILERDASFKPNTVQGTIWNLDATNPTRVYKPSRGVFRLLGRCCRAFDSARTAVARARTRSRIAS